MEDTQIEDGGAIETLPAATLEESGKIRAINKNTVHKICSGQVVLSLAVAVKELVENSIDAGATIIEVKLYEHGAKSLEVSDNGSGVEACSLEAMTAKYHTSKIREFVDLQAVETFGFRGEALSSLCALADMTILTRHKSTDIGTKVELDHDGKIKTRAPCARSIGTTVTLSNLFSTLPVRKRDFTRNIKKEFAKMCQMLQGYCLVAKGVRIICSNHMEKSGKTTVLQTHGANNVLDNITAVFGSRQSTELMPVKPAFDSNAQELSNEAIMTDLKTLDDLGERYTLEVTDEDAEKIKDAKFNLEGYISSCSHGAGRSSKDRQFFFVNSRPCDPKNIAKVVNEIYHRYNSHQYPFVFLNILTPRIDIDVNLTPDKRQLLIHNEKILLLLLKKALTNTFANVPSSYKLQNTTLTKMIKSSDQNCSEDVSNSEKPDTDCNNEDKDIEDGLVPVSSSQRFMEALSQWKHTGVTKVTGTKSKTLSSLKRKTGDDDEVEARTLKLQKIHSFLSQNNENTLNILSKKKVASNYLSDSNSDTETEQSKSLPTIEKLNAQSKEYDTLTRDHVVESIDCKTASIAKPFLTFINNKKSSNDESKNDFKLPNSQESITSDGDEFSCSEPRLSQTTIELDGSDAEQESANIEAPVSARMSLTLPEIATTMKAEEEIRNARRSKARLESLRFKSAINPSQNQNAEEELQKEIRKSDFLRMEIIGQFNLGFIVVQLDDDLFIVDQHATDEKYNFETLQRTTVLQSQPLAVPQTLEMTVVNEMILLDHLEVFQKNGFKFEIDQNALPTRRVKLLCKPFSKNWEFGKEDIDELIFMLQDAPEGTICRPSRIRAMFASRACRSSVMIGKALNKKSMKNLIIHMGEIEQPWNCPHGRPTMRHLINLAMLRKSDDDDHDNT